jgi:hypothetical protein
VQTRVNGRTPDFFTTCHVIKPLFLEIPMQKLLDTYKLNPTQANATKLYKYKLKHPFGDSFLSPADVAILKQAIALVGGSL